MKREDDQNERVVDQFSRQAPDYARLINAQKSRSKFDRLAFIDPRPEDRVLDIACGTGALALSIADRVDHVTGIDLTPAMIDQARATQVSENLKNIDWQIGDVASLPFDSNRFTLVVCSAAFHHFEKPLDVLAEMSRVCTPRGRILVNDVTPSAEKSAQFDRIEHLKDSSHTHALTLDELRQLGDRVDLVELRLASYAATLPLDAVLSAAFPEEVTIDEIRQMLKQDAVRGQDIYGLSAEMQGEQVIVSYPMSAVLWEKPVR